jgi:UDP-N-acetylmuramate--alanine ligase
VQLGAEAVAVTSVGSDHLDFYGTREQLDRAFVTFLNEAPGPAVFCLDDPGAAAVAARVNRDLVAYGTTDGADVRVRGVDLSPDAATFSLVERGGVHGPFNLSVPGMHNVLNAAGAASLAVSIGVSWDQAIDGLASYQGVSRRFETRGSVEGVTFIDDYAHNPEKVAAALATARGGSWRRVVAVFQPHRFSRTEAMWREFGPALSGADLLVVTGIYAAGEQPRAGVSGRLITDAVRQADPGGDVRYVETLDEVELLLRDELRSGDLCLTLGAGDITHLASRFIDRGTLKGA